MTLTLPRTSTGTILDIAAQLLSYYGLERTNLINTGQDAVSIEAAVFRAVTGRIPNSFTRDPKTAELLLETNEPTQEALAWISAVLPTDAPHDPDTGIDDHLEHIRTWVSTPDFFTEAVPTPFEVVGVLQRAKQTAENLAAAPAQRIAA
ncbi:DUF6197 family protein [Streptomyces sp. BE133]|uniref:DUF6197 family protein n=1 Tax=Streptomyces sp. BE133 TaxID=3002523 RepID=UPI002E77E9B0|nr:hypothetical protein [Streptomyces sp. BE133]MEE1812664.1 hypothetical protein [Streptomyces sp. BE133]